MHGNRYVWHKRCPEWGSGVVVSESAKKTEVLFEKAGRKKLSNVVADLEELHESEILPDSPLRDKLRWREVEKRKEFTASFDAMISEFTALFPEGFSDGSYLASEREYKEAAVKKAREVLAREHLSVLMDNSNYDEIFRLARMVVSRTNLIFTFEQIKFGALPEIAHKTFASLLFDLLHRGEDYPRSVEHFGDFLSQYDAAKWTIATYFGFICDPQNRVFVKPKAVQHAAKALHRDLQYDSHPNANTYSGIVHLYREVKQCLEEKGFKPRDMIDVQGFLWIGSGMHRGG
jgi:hypothetical protein